MRWLHVVLCCMCLVGGVALAAPSDIPDPPANGMPSQTPQNATNPATGAVVNFPKAQDAVVNFDNWMAAMGSVIDGAELRDKVRVIAIAIFAIGIFFVIFDVRKYGLIDGVENAVMRILIASFVLFLSTDWNPGRPGDAKYRNVLLEPPTVSTPSVGSVRMTLPDIFKYTWHWGFKYSTEKTSGMYLAGATQLSQFASRIAGKDMMWTKALLQDQGTAPNGNDPAQTTSMTWVLDIMMVVSGALMIMMSGTYAAVIIASALVIIVGKLFFPIIAAMLIYPGSFGINGVLNWGRVMLTSTLTGWLLPVMFGLATYVAIALPLQMTESGFSYVEGVVEWIKSSTATASADPSSWASNAQTIQNSWLVGDIFSGILTLAAFLAIVIVSVSTGIMIAGNILWRTNGLVNDLFAGFSNFAGSFGDPAGRFLGRTYDAGSSVMATSVASMAGGAGNVAAASANMAASAWHGAAATAQGGLAAGAQVAAGGLAVGAHVAAKALGGNTALQAGATNSQPNASANPGGAGGAAVPTAHPSLAQRMQSWSGKAGEFSGHMGEKAINNLGVSSGHAADATNAMFGMRSNHAGAIRNDIATMNEAPPPVKATTTRTALVSATPQLNQPVNVSSFHDPYNKQSEVFKVGYTDQNGQQRVDVVGKNDRGVYGESWKRATGSSMVWAKENNDTEFTPKSGKA